MLFGAGFEEVQRALDVCVAYAADHRFEFNVGKCAVVSSEERVELRMGGELVPQVEEFLYLGVPFLHSGIGWARHWARMGAKAMNTASFMHSVGINGGGVDVVTALSVYKGFVRPVLEYGLPLCGPREAKPVERFHKAAVRKLASLSKGVSVDAIGLFGEVVGMEVRRTVLQAKWIARVASRDETYAVHYAWIEQRAARYKLSCLYAAQNVVVRRRGEVARYRAWDAGGVRGLPQPTILSQRDVEEAWIRAVCDRLSSAWVWKGKSRDARKNLRRLVRAAGRLEARRVVLWVANMA